MQTQWVTLQHSPRRATGGEWTKGQKEDGSSGSQIWDSSVLTLAFGSPPQYLKAISPTFYFPSGSFFESYTLEQVYLPHQEQGHLIIEQQRLKSRRQKIWVSSVKSRDTGFYI